MKILALDTSGENCTASIVSEEKVIANFSVSSNYSHSEMLLPLIDEMCKSSNVKLEDVDAFACSIGPGSFTGLRIGISTIKGFALSLNKKVIAVPTLLGLAYNVKSFCGTVCSVLDAKNDNVYAAIYKNENDNLIMQGDYCTGSIDELLSQLTILDSDVIFVGDGSVSFKEKIINSLKTRAHFAPTHLNNQLSISIGQIALEMANKDAFITADELTPMYLKKSQAEREAEN